MKTKNVWFFVAMGNMVKICGWQCLLQNANNCIRVLYIYIYIYKIIFTRTYFIHLYIIWKMQFVCSRIALARDYAYINKYYVRGRGIPATEFRFMASPWIIYRN